MSDLYERLRKGKVLDVTLRCEIEETFGNRGRKALAALDSGKIIRYLDFFVVSGRTAEYVVDEDFCTCGDFMFRGRTCWHLLAVRIAQETGIYNRDDSWYQERWSK
jgi:predicted nucleic acid-binding Zn finger protein